MKKLTAMIQTPLLAFSLAFTAPAQQPATQTKQPEKQADKQAGKSQAAAPQKEAPAIDRRKVPLAQRPNLSLEDVNTFIGVDKRVIVMMAALNVAGYDYEAGNRPISALRQQMREDLKNTPPEIARKLRNHFLAHRKGNNDAAAVAPYLSLALSLNEPPAFTFDVAADCLPEDVREITDFVLLLEEFYQTTGFSKLLPKYVASYIKAAEAYPQAAGVALGNVLVYLHTEPILELPPLFPVRPTAPAKSAKPEKKDEKKSDKPGKKDKQDKSGKPEQQAVAPVVAQQESPNRIRQFVIIPDLFNASNAANLRIVRDTHFLL
ncbi:MAG TPA: hypothetical protein PKD31_02915, partial [Blastocatellia bacterium]|nr:hypothetical protein [Blastocatellia bacterium]